MTAPEAPRSARTVHHVRGRIRLKIAGSKGEPRLLEEIRQAIAPLKGVKSVDVNPATGSVVVHYNPAMHEGFQAHLATHGENAGSFILMPPEISEVDELAKKIEQEAEFLSEHSAAARTIVDAFKTADRALKIATDNTVDLKVLLPLGLAVYSFVEIGLEASTPLWVTLGIFSFNSFLALHAPQPKTKTTAVLVDSTGQDFPPQGEPVRKSKTRKSKAAQP